MIRLVWDNLTIAEWQSLLGQAIRPPLSLSWPYAVTQLKTHRWMAHFGLLEVDDEPVAIIQTLEKKALGGLLSTAQCHGGPAWLVDRIDPLWRRHLLIGLRQRYPAKPWRKFRAYPTWPDDNSPDWQDAGFKRVGPGYQTIWLDIRPEMAMLRQQLRPNWRQSLTRADRLGLTIESDTRGKLLPWLIERHLAFRAQRGFVGPDGRFLVHLHGASYKKQDFLLLRADLPDQQGVAACLFIRHGHAATYLIACSDETGKKSGAQNALIWQAIEMLRGKGVEWLDLGGINPGESPGLSYFKTGLNGMITQGPGVFT